MPPIQTVPILYRTYFTEMKKTKLTAVFALVLFCLTSCFGYGDGKDLPYEESVDILDTSIQTDPVESETEAEESPAYTLLFIDLDTQTSAEGRLNISYPAFSGMENADALTETSLNHIKEFATSYGTYKKPGEGSYCVSFDSEEVTYGGEKLTSFFFVGSCSAESSADSVIFTHAMNIDVAAGKILEFSDVFTDYDILADVFKAGKFELIETGNATVDSELSAMPAEQHLIGYSELYGIYPEFYFTGGDAGIDLVLSLEEIPVLGYHAEFRTDVENVREILTDRAASLIIDN